VEEREREVSAWESKNEREGVGHAWGGGAPGVRLGRAGSRWAVPRDGLGHRPGRQPTTHSRLPLIEIKP
jgi:hypothetical protein